MNTIKHHISRFFLPVLLLVAMASCSFPTYNRYGYNHRPRPHYGYHRPILPPPARPGWYGRW